MSEKYLLYIDILGFTKLARESAAIVDDLYRRIASLNVHKHPDFATIVFSDTVLVHCAATPKSPHDHSYVVMFMCEFVQDLLHRLAGRDVAFRAVLTYGEFEHYYLNEIPCFFGPALIHAYETEKEIKATGLYIDNTCNRHNEIFSTARLNEEWSFVFLTQQMNTFEDQYEGTIPLPDTLVIDTDFGWHWGPEIIHFEHTYRQSLTHPDANVRQKYSRTWKFYSERYPRACASLVGIDFHLESINRKFPWQELRDRIRDETYDWASTKRLVEPKP